MIFTIARSELRRMFYSPVAWVILALVLFILAWLFLYLLNYFVTELQPRLAATEAAPGVTDLVAAPVLLWAGVIMLGISPLLTMRAFSEERQIGSLTLLISAPVSMTEIVLGKYLGLILFVLLMLGLLALMPMSLALGTTLDWGKLAAGLIGLFLLLASFTAAGLFLSSVTNTPLISAVSSFGLLLFLIVLYLSGSSQRTGSELFVYLSHFGHYISFLEGMFETSGLVYYILFSGTFLILTVWRLESQRVQRA